MLRAYRLFLTVVILIGSLVAPCFLADSAFGFVWTLLIMTALAGILFSLYVLWGSFIPAQWKKRGVQIGYTCVCAIVSISELLISLYVLSLQVRDFVRNFHFEVYLAIATVVLIIVPPYTLWVTFIRPLSNMTPHSQTGTAGSSRLVLLGGLLERLQYPESLAGSMLIALILLISQTTYHLVVGH
jgi:hypothetical protein